MSQFIDNGEPTSSDEYDSSSSSGSDESSGTSMSQMSTESASTSTKSVEEVRPPKAGQAASKPTHQTKLNAAPHKNPAGKKTSTGIIVPKFITISTPYGELTAPENEVRATKLKSGTYKYAIGKHVVASGAGVHVSPATH